MKKEIAKIPLWAWIVIAVVVLAVLFFILTPKIRIVPSQGEYNKTNPSIFRGEGACVTVNEYHLKRCEMSLESSCNGTFYKGLLCSAQSVGTVCAPTNRNTTYGSKVYFIDSCGNIANPYIESQVNNRSYWNELVE